MTALQWPGLEPTTAVGGEGTKAPVPGDVVNTSQTQPATPAGPDTLTANGVIYTRAPDVGEGAYRDPNGYVYVTSTSAPPQPPAPAAADPNAWPGLPPGPAPATPPPPPVASQGPAAPPSAAPTPAESYIEQEGAPLFQNYKDLGHGAAEAYGQATGSRPFVPTDPFGIPSMAKGAFETVAQPLTDMGALTHAALIRPGASALAMLPQTQVTSSPFDFSKPPTFAQMPYDQRERGWEGALNTAMMAMPAPEAGAAPAAQAAPRAFGLDPAIPVPRNVAQRAAGYAAVKTANQDPLMLAAATSGKPVTAAEMGGSPGQIALRALASRPGATGPTVEGMFSGPFGRPAQSTAMMKDDFASATGVDPGAAGADITTALKAGRAQVSPHFDAALYDTQTGADGTVTQTPKPINMTSDLASVLQEPEVQTALGHAMRKVGTKATLPGIKIDPDTGAPAIDPLTQQPIIEQQPTAQTLNEAREFMNKAIVKDQFQRPKMDGPEGIANEFTLSNAKRLTQALAGDAEAGIPPAIPGLRTALDVSGDYLGNLSASNKGGTLTFNPKVSVDQYAEEFGRHTPAQQEAWLQGIAREIFERANNGQLTATSLLGNAAAPKLGIAKKLEIAMGGPEQAQQFLQGVGHVSAMNKNAAFMLPRSQSPTAAVNAEIASQDKPTGALPFVLDMAQDVAARGSPHKAVFSAASRAVQSGIDAIRANQVTMSQPVRDEAGRILLSGKTPSEIAAYANSLWDAPPRTDWGALGSGALKMTPGAGWSAAMLPKRHSPAKK